MFFKRTLLPALATLAFIDITIAAPITFTSHKSSDMSSLSRQFLQQMVDVFNCDIFVETGTYLGNTTAKASNLFNTVHTVEAYKPLALRAQTRFINQSHITVHHGTSPDVFNKILPDLKKQGPIFFFLDAHYSGEGTGTGKEGPNVADGITAIRQELAAICENKVQDCIILIDDIRGFGTQTDSKTYLGCWAYPPLKDVCTQLHAINKNFSSFLIGDMLLSFDTTRFSVQLSPVVMACTISRLFDGANFTEEEILEAEHVISQAKGEEKAFIEKLYTMMTQYQDPEFHYDLWYGLLCLNDKKYPQAKREFDKVLKRGYTHPRIHSYLTCTQQ